MRARVTFFPGVHGRASARALQKNVCVSFSRMTARRERAARLLLLTFAKAWCAPADSAEENVVIELGKSDRRVPSDALVLVTGGAGFIGSHLANLLAESGFRVRVIDALHEQVHGSEPGFPQHLHAD